MCEFSFFLRTVQLLGGRIRVATVYEFLRLRYCYAIMFMNLSDYYQTRVITPDNRQLSRNVDYSESK